MKKVWLVLSLMLLMSGNVSAKMTPTTFNANEPITAGKLFLNQVDTVSLYLTNEKIIYVPRMGKDMHLNVSLTLLKAPDSDPDAIQHFVMRHIQTFNKTLKERLEFYAPQLAKEFNPDQDVDFTVKLGADQKTVATWMGGKWNWVETPKQISEAAPQPKKLAQAKKCPAMIGN